MGHDSIVATTQNTITYGNACRALKMKKNDEKHNKNNIKLIY